MIIESITIDSAEKCELINITSHINDIIRENNVESGLVNISTRHTTSGIIINEDESGLKEDIVNVFEDIIPYKNYLHDRIDNNARSHLMATITTPTQTLPIVDGRLSLGTWQSIFFLELDGPRLNRKVTISILRD